MHQILASFFTFKKKQQQKRTKAHDPYNFYQRHARAVEIDQTVSLFSIVGALSSVFLEVRPGDTDRDLWRVVSGCTTRTMGCERGREPREDETYRDLYA